MANEYIQKTGTANPFNGIDIGNDSTPTLADLDGDGDRDAIVGEIVILYYYKKLLQKKALLNQTMNANFARIQESVWVWVFKIPQKKIHLSNQQCQSINT